MIEYFGITVIVILAVVGGLVTILKFFSLSTSAISWWAIHFEKWSKKYKSNILTKNAIKYNIELRVNATVFDLQKELPNRWVKKMAIKWVNVGNIKRLKSGESIIRIEPENRQDYNMINGVYNYFHHTLFPDTFEVVPPRILNAISLRLSSRTLENSTHYQYLAKIFNETILEREIQKDSVLLNFIEPFHVLDNRGFLTGALVREIDSLASKIRVSSKRNSFETIVDDTTKHMIDFTSAINRGKGAIPVNLWEYDNNVHKYRFLLASREAHMKIDGHLKRAKIAYEEEADRLYVFGRNRDLLFTKKLIKRIEKETEYKLLEIFDLDKDYHSQKKGIGALFIR